MPVAPTWFDTVGRSDDEERFLGVLRAAEPLWRELDIEGPDAGVVCGETGPLMAYIDLTDGSGIYSVLRVDLLGGSIVAGHSDPEMVRDLDRDGPDTLVVAGTPVELGEAAIRWFEGQLRRPVEAWEWTAPGAEGGAPARAIVFADTGERLTWMTADVGVAWGAGGSWGDPVANERPPDSVVVLRHDRRQRG